jgi:hypothetical protein
MKRKPAFIGNFLWYWEHGTEPNVKLLPNLLFRREVRIYMLEIVELVLS